MTHASRWIVLVAVSLLGLSAFIGDADAGRCKPQRPCTEATGPPAYYLEAQADFGLIRKKRRERRPREALPPEISGDEPDYGNEPASGSLIPQSLAVTQALAAYPGATPLGVKLLPGPSPVYAVKLRVDGQVLRVRIDAQSGQILGQ